LNLWPLTTASDLDNGRMKCYGRDMTDFLTIAQAVQFTGKSRRTLTRLATRLAQAGSEEVMSEKTARGYIWRISQQRLQTEYGAVTSPSPMPTIQESTPASLPVPIEMSHALEVASQGYTSLLAMHQEVKQLYAERILEKEAQIAALAQELAQRKKGFWAWLFGG
jgi:hypothetical protein